MIILPQDFSDCRGKPQLYHINDFSPVYLFAEVLNVTFMIRHISPKACKAYFKNILFW